MAKKAKRARKKAAPKVEFRHDEPKPEIKPETATEPKIKTAEPAEPPPEPVVPPKPTTGQCANCGQIVPIKETFKCHHCGKTGCPKCGWDKKKFSVCPNCATIVLK